MSQPTVERTLSGFRFTWPDMPVAVALSRLKDSSSGTKAEFVASLVSEDGKERTLLHQSLNLLTSKAKLCKELQGRFDAPWESMLEQVCVLSLRQLRQGEPIESLEPIEGEETVTPFILNPILYQHNPTVLYGPGDSMKSFLALYWGMCLASGQCGHHVATSPDPWKVLWLDWEMSAGDLRKRAQLIRRGDTRLIRTPDYRRYYRPLLEHVEELKRDIADHGYDVLIVDSLGMAAGGMELERADAAIAFHGALRALNVTALIIGHTPKDQEGKARSLFGSVYFRNLARVMWEVRREGDLVGLYQDKNNLGRKHAPLGYQIAVDDAACVVTTADLSDDPSLAAHLPLHERLTTALRSTPGQTVEALATTIGEDESTIRTILNRYKTRFLKVNGLWEYMGA